MSVPHKAGLTMFYTEGNPVALVVSNVEGKRTDRKVPIANGEAALDWCRQHGSVMVYLPFDMAGLAKN